MAGRAVVRKGAAMAIALVAAILASAMSGAVAAPVDPFLGTWDTFTTVQPTPHFNLNILKIDDTTIQGYYQPHPSDPVGSITGTVDGSGTLNYTWMLAGVHGTGSFTVTGGTLFGAWQVDGSPIGGTWTGSRPSGISINGSGITINLGGGAGAITIPITGGTPATPPPASATPPPAPSIVPIFVTPPPGPTQVARVTSNANIHNGPGKNYDVSAILIHDSTVAYDPSCPAGYCGIAWQTASGATGSGYIWANLLDFGSAGGPPDSSTGGSGSSGSGGSPAPVDFSGTWNLTLSGATSMTLAADVTQTGATASLDFQVSPPFHMDCTVNGKQMTCSGDDSGDSYSGNLVRTGNSLSGKWSLNGTPAGTWGGPKL